MTENNFNNFRIYCFIPKKLEFMVSEKFIYHKGFKLKTAYIAHILNEIIFKYTSTGEQKFKIWTTVLQQMYGKHYARYIEFLIDEGVIKLIANKQVGKTSRRYKLNLDFIRGEKIKRYYFYDKFLRKKIDSRKLETTFTSLLDTTILKEVREKLVRDLDFVSLDCQKSLKYLLSIKNNITSESFIKNFLSITNIDNKEIFFKFDGYGRFHTNFTILKKYIRQNFLKIDNSDVFELDIQNSQPFFLTILMKNEYKDKQMPQGLINFIGLVNNNIFYDDFKGKESKYIKDRDTSKKFIYKVLFGTNQDTKINRMFKEHYPEVFDFIVSYKKKNGSHKTLSHKLQRMESDFLFNVVIYEIMALYPDVRIVTVHDSIMFPVKYRMEVENIFHNHLNELKK
jgi:hypothetical protein